MPLWVCFNRKDTATAAIWGLSQKIPMSIKTIASYRLGETLIREPVLPNGQSEREGLEMVSMDHSSGFTSEMTNTWWPPACFSPSTALSIPNQNFMPLGHSAGSRSFRERPLIWMSFTVKRLDMRIWTLNPWVKVCTARTPSGRQAISLGSRMMLMWFF